MKSLTSLVPAVPIPPVVAVPPVVAPAGRSVRSVLRALFAPTPIPPGKMCDYCGEYLATVALYRPSMVCERCHWG